MITMMVLLCYLNLSGMSLECKVIVIMNNSPLGGQFCTDSVDIQQWSNNSMYFNKLAIVPRLNFTCSGTLTSIRARLFNVIGANAYPYFQVWRLTSVGLTIYNKIGEVQLQPDDPVTKNSINYWGTNITLAGNHTIEVQSGDVVGYYHPPNACYLVMDIPTNGYWLYQFNRSAAPNSINISERDVMFSNRQPLLQFTIVDMDYHCLHMYILYVIHLYLKISSVTS